MDGEKNSADGGTFFESAIYQQAAQGGLRRILTETVLERSNLPMRMRNYRVSDLHSANLEKIRPWVEEWSPDTKQRPSKGLFLYGNYNQAEIAMAVCLMSIRRRFFDVYYIHAQDITKLATDNDDAILRRASLLGVGGLGMEHSDKGGYIESTITGLFNNRSEWENPMIICSFLKTGDLLKRYKLPMIETIEISTTVIECV